VNERSGKKTTKANPELCLKKVIDHFFFNENNDTQNEMQIDVPKSKVITAKESLKELKLKMTN
jgi:uncharacterized protein YeaC (DUF1315 family)